VRETSLQAPRVEEEEVVLQALEQTPPLQVLHGQSRWACPEGHCRMWRAYLEHTYPEGLQNVEREER